jgi:Nucleosome binding factor SPN, SPT16 subunit
MRWLILMLAGAFILTGCSDTDEPPIDEPETSEADTEESVTEETETTETADEEDAESEEESDETASENTENESETEEVEEAAEPVDVMEGTELASGYWINYSGEDDARSYMTRTEPMEYNPEQDYTVTAASYVSTFTAVNLLKQITTGMTDRIL